MADEKLAPASDATALRCPRCDSPSPELHPAVQFEGEVQPCADPWHDRARIPVGYRKINAHLVRNAPTSDATALDRLIEHLDMIRELVWECAPKCKDDLMAHLTTAIKRTRDIRGAVPPVPVEGLDLESALKAVGIGGNHLASALLSLKIQPSEWRDANYDEMLARFGQPASDMWVAWKAIMDMRDVRARLAAVEGAKP